MPPVPSHPVVGSAGREVSQPGVPLADESGEMITPMTSDSPLVLSEIADLRDVPLADMPSLGVAHEVVGRAVPGLPGVPVPAASAAFQSAI